MNTLIRLELRKHLILFAASVVMFLLLVSTVSFSIEIILVFFVGVFGCVIGVRSGTDSDSTPDVLAPVSPVKRAVSGLVVVLIYGILLLLLVYLVVACFYPPTVWLMIPGADAVFASFAAAISLYCCCYAFASGPIGIAVSSVPLAAVFIAGGMTVTGLAWFGSAISMKWYYGLYFLLLSSSLLAMLSIRARTTVLKPRNYAARNIAAMLVGLAGPAAILCVGWYTRYSMENRLLPGKLYISEDKCASDKVAEGLFMFSVRGAAAVLYPDGTIRRLLPPDNKSLFALPLASHASFSAAYSADGTLWVLRGRAYSGAGRRYQVWSFGLAGQGKLETWFDEPAMRPVLQSGNSSSPLLFASVSGRNWFAPLPEKGGAVRWRQEDDKERDRRMYDEGQALLPDGKSAFSAKVDGKKVVCRIPLLAGHDYKYGFPRFSKVEGKLIFSAFMSDGQLHLVSCGLDGKTATVKIPVGAMKPIANHRGGWAMARKLVSDSGPVDVLTPDGGILRGIDLIGRLSNLTGQPECSLFVVCLRVRGEQVDFLVSGDGLYVVSINVADKNSISIKKLPVSHIRAANLIWASASGDGFFISALPRLYFVHWDGRFTRLAI